MISVRWEIRDWARTTVDTRGAAAVSKRAYGLIFWYTRAHGLMPRVLGAVAAAADDRAWSA